MKEKQINETHLGYIQNAIDRMSRCSFQSKAWNVTIVSALIALYLTDRNNRSIIIIASIATLLFMLLDMYYLYLERGFIKLYNLVAEIDVTERVQDYSMSIPNSYKGLCSYLKAFLSVSTGLFYGAIIIALLIFYFFIK